MVETNEFADAEEALGLALERNPDAADDVARVRRRLVARKEKGEAAERKAFRGKGV